MDIRSRRKKRINAMVYLRGVGWMKNVSLSLTNDVATVFTSREDRRDSMKLTVEQSIFPHRMHLVTYQY